MRQVVELTPHEWQQVLAVLSGGPWSAVNPLIMQIGEQLRLQGVQNARPDGEDRPPAAKTQ